MTESGRPSREAVILDLIANAGIRVADEDVRLINWEHRPPARARPLQESSGVKRRNKFSTKEEQLLLEWVSAAQEQFGEIPNFVFEHLEGVAPEHSYSAWKSKWQNRKKDSNTLKTVNPDLSLPGLHLHENLRPTMDPHPAVEPTNKNSNATIPLLDHPTGGGDTYTQGRVDTIKSQLLWLNLPDEEAFKAFLLQDWVMDAYMELAEAELDHIKDTYTASMKNNDPSPSPVRDRSVHWAKAAKAATVIRNGGDRYLKLQQDKSNWLHDDHAIRFIVSLVLRGRIEGNCWAPYQSDEDLSKLCEKATVLMMWLQWLHRPTGSNGGTGASQRSQGRVQERYLDLLHGRRSQIRRQAATQSSPLDNDRNVEMTDVSSPFAGIIEPLSQPEATVLVRSDGEAAGDNMTDINLHTQPKPIGSDRNALLSRAEDATAFPVHRLPKSKSGKQQKGAAWITYDAVALWNNHFEHRINGWGLETAHSGTCILVPHDWRHEDPSALVDRFVLDDIDKSEGEHNRLMFSYGDVTITWARAAVWFAKWKDADSYPSGADLDAFFKPESGDWNEMHASHLCHHGLCINSNHLVYETKMTNLSRNKCANFARYKRQYDERIPQYCQDPEHHPPCLLQHAALTMSEALSIQFSILREAMCLAVAPPPPRPVSHDPRFKTFDHRLPIEMRTKPFSIVTLDSRHLITPPASRRSLGKVPFQCAFCTTIRKWTKIQSFYSHIRNEHNDVSRDVRLAEVSRQTASYLQWRENMKYNQESESPRIWNMMQQTQRKDFNWDAFAAWTLHDDRKTEVRS